MSLSITYSHFLSSDSLLQMHQRPLVVNQAKVEAKKPVRGGLKPGGEGRVVVVASVRSLWACRCGGARASALRLRGFYLNNAEAISVYHRRKNADCHGVQESSRWMVQRPYGRVGLRYLSRFAGRSKTLSEVVIVPVCTVPSNAPVPEATRPPKLSISKPMTRWPCRPSCSSSCRAEPSMKRLYS